MNKGQDKEARRWEKELKKGKGGWDPYLSLLRWYHSQGKREKEEELIRKAPTHALKAVMEALRLHLQGEEEKVASLIEGIETRDKKEASWLSLLKGLRGNSAALQESLRLYPQHPWAREIKILIGHHLLRGGKEEEALGHLISVGPEKDPQVSLLVGEIYHRMGNDLAARRYLEEAMNKGQGDTRLKAAHMVARLARQREEWDKVASALRIILKATPEDPHHLITGELVEALIKGGKVKEAISILEGLESEESQDLWIMLASTLERKREWQRALDAWKRVNGIKGIKGKGRVLLAIGKPKEAAEVLEGCKEEECLHILAQALWEEGRKEASLNVLRSLSEVWCREHPQAALLRAQGALEMDRIEEAAQWALKAYEYIEQGERKKVKPVLKKVRAALKGSPEADRWLSHIEEALKEPPFFKRLKEGLFKSRQGMTRRIEEVLGIKEEVGREQLERIEEVLISADVGVKTTSRLINALEKKMSRGDVRGREGLLTALKEEILLVLKKAQGKIEVGPPPWVIMMVGVNGTGKTTTIAKLARRFTNEGKKVLLAAGDTFRAAATEQLEIWAQRVGVPVVKQLPGSHPSGVVYDAVQAAKARGTDVVIIDTAGRLHTKVNLMEELKKMVRVASKELPHAPHEILLVLDATTGQNALSQARLFSQAIPITGLVLTKLDGTAKGGIIIGVAGEFSIPIKLIGVGEGMDDLQDFDAEAFVEALFDSY